MLNYNLDVCDSLTNGSQGTVIDFKFDKNNKIKYVMVKFDESESGRERRKCFNFEEEYPGQKITPIEIKETQFSLSKNKTFQVKCGDKTIRTDTIQEDFANIFHF